MDPPRWPTIAGPGTGSGLRGLANAVGPLVIATACVPFLARLVQGPSSGALDSSWASVLCHAQRQGLHFGTDIVFTYGPLGYLATNDYSGGEPAAHVRVAVVLALLTALPLVLLARALAWPMRILLGLCIVSAPLVNVGGDDTFVQVALAGWGILCMAPADRGESPRGVLAAHAGLVAFAVLASLIKFSWLVAAFGTVAAVGANLVLRRRTAAAATLAAAAAATFLSGWLMAGQPLTALPPFLFWSAQVAGGYAGAMGSRCPSWVMAAGAVVAFTSLWTAADRVRRAALPDDTNLAIRRGLLLAWLAGLLFVSWKHAFVRADLYHFVGLFAFCAMVCPLLLAIPRDTARPDRQAAGRAIGVAIVAVAVVAAWLPVASPAAALRQVAGAAAANSATVFRHRQYADTLRRAWENSRRWHTLERATALIGTASVDVFGQAQGYALASGLTYTPRPVFQSYSTYNRPLSLLNEAFWLSENGPAWLLFELAPIDGRYPALEDSRCLRAALGNFRMVGSDRRFLIFRREGRAGATLEPLQSGRADIGQRIDVSAHAGRDLWLEIDVRPTLVARLLAALVRPPATRLRIWAANEDGDGTVFHAPAPMLAAGFVASPILADNDDVIDAAAGKPATRLAAFAVEASGSGRGGSCEWRLFAVSPGLVGHPDPALALLRWPGFSAEPVACRGRAPKVVDLDGRRMVQVDAPGELELAVPDGGRQLSGLFGMLSDSSRGGASDGAEFAVELVAPDGSRTRLAHWRLDPGNRVSDRGARDFRFDLPPGSGRRLVLLTLPGPAGDASWDFTCWSDIVIH
ncbi:MAG: hypothetical protein DWI03_08030 [Planctomycetota bacterium]|nr:MAG: hypothetical protein DWI03_08030 [Planctomycetota bacterium]